MGIDLKLCMKIISRQVVLRPLTKRHYRSQFSLCQIVHDVGVLEWYVGISKVGIGQRLLRYSGQALPSDQWLLDTDGAGGRKLVIERKVADVLGQRACAGETWACCEFRVVGSRVIIP